MRSLLLLLALTAVAHADEIATVTLDDSGPNQDVPAGRAFYLAGAADARTIAAQAVVVRVGSPALLSRAAPSCANVQKDLHLEATARSAADDADAEDDEADDDLDFDLAAAPTALHTGVHRAFELFPRAELALRDATILVTPAWHRARAGDAEYRILVPGDAQVFATGYRFCAFVITTEHEQVLDDTTLAEQVDALAKRLVDCGDRTSCADEALDDYETRLAHVLAHVRGPDTLSKQLAARLKERARVELGAATGLIEARDRFEDRWRASATSVMQPDPSASLWLPLASDPFAFAASALLARAAALLPQVTAKQTVALFSDDGRVLVTALQLLDDGKSIRVAASAANPGSSARVLTATTDQLPIADGLVLYDLIALGAGKIQIDHQTWVTLDAIAQRIAALGTDEWTGEDAAFLASALAQLRRLDHFVEKIAADATCKPAAKIGNAEAELTPAATERHLGDWLACRKLDVKALDSLVELLADLVTEDGAWKQAKAQLATRSRPVVTLTTSAPVAHGRVSFARPAWTFSYVTPVFGVAAVLRTDESFGLPLLGAELHLAPNAVDDVQWAHGITGRDLRRAVALELAVAPERDGFGPDARFGGPGALPPIFAGIALHVIPYTSLSFGAAITSRRRSTLMAEDPHVVVSPYLGFSVQLNLPDLVRTAVQPSSQTWSEQ